MQRVGAEVAPDGTAMHDWRIAAELALRLGTDFDLETVDEVQDEIARVAPAFAGVDAALLRRARDGVVLPLAEHHDELVLDAGALPITDASMGADPTRDDRVRGGPRLARRHRRGRVERTGSSTTVKPGLTEVEVRRRPAEAAEPRPQPSGDRRAARPPRLGRGRRRPAPVGLATRTLSASWPAARSTTGATSPRARRRSLRSRPHPSCSCTRTTATASASTDGAEVRLTSSRGYGELPVRADAAVPQRRRVPRVPPGRPGAADLDRRRRARHRPARGDHPVRRSRGDLARPALRRGDIDLDGRPHRHRQDVVDVRAAARRA